MSASEKYVVLRRGQFARAALSGWTKLMTEAGLFSKAEADLAVGNSKGDGWSTQPLEYYRDFLIDQSHFLEEKFDALGMVLPAPKVGL